MEKGSQKAQEKEKTKALGKTTKRRAGPLPPNKITLARS